MFLSPFLFAAGRDSIFLKKGPLLSWHARHPQQTLPKYKAGGHFSQNRWAIKSRKSGKHAYRQCAVPTGWVSKSCEQVGRCLPPQCCQTIAPTSIFAKSWSTVKTRKRQKPHPPELRMFKTKGSTDTWPAHGPQDWLPKQAHMWYYLRLRFRMLLWLSCLGWPSSPGGGQEKSCIKGRSDPQPQ